MAVGSILAYHVSIRQAIQDRDATEAERLMEEHIRYAMGIALKVRGKPQLEGLKSLFRNWRNRKTAMYLNYGTTTTALPRES